jgi:hypothetical protein
MTRDLRKWIAEGLAPDAYEALTRTLSPSQLWSLLLEVIQARAAARDPGRLMEQWNQDRFVQPGKVDQRTAIEVDRCLLASASAFEAIELSPVAPLGVCSVMGLASQNKVLSALRGTEVVADPTNVMALECAGRLRENPAEPVRLATAHRCIRAQEIPKQPGFSAHFRIFCLATAGHEKPNHELAVNAVVEQITTMLNALDSLERQGYGFPERRVTVLATSEKAALADRIAANVAAPSVVRSLLEHPYYDGLRFQIAARSKDGADIPLIDGGTFDWVSKLTSNRRMVFAATGMGSQLVPLLFRSDRAAAASLSGHETSN